MTVPCSGKQPRQLPPPPSWKRTVGPGQFPWQVMISAGNVRPSQMLSFDGEVGSFSGK